MTRSVFTGLRAFSAIMAGQAVSTIGSGMTRFGLGIWVFATTGDAEAFSTLLFFAVLPVGLGSLFAGPMVDRFSRRGVMLVANAVASLSTLAVALLYFTETLALWHLYVALFVNGVANAFVLPAFESSIPLMVPKEQLARAAGFVQLVRGVESILAPALAGLLVGTLGLGAIFVTDFVTFGASILALMASEVPQPGSDDEPKSMWAQFVFGVQYILERPAFLYLMSFITLTMFLLPGLGYALITPLILTFSTEQVAGLVVSAFGFGSVLGGILLTAWGGPKRRMHGILGSMSLAGVATVLVGVRESPVLMAAAFVVMGVCFVIMMGLNRVLWQTKAAPEVLGRVFAIRVALGVGAQSLGILVAGILAERVFEPMLLEGGALSGSVGALVGVGEGRGMGFMFVLSGVAQLVMALGSLLWPPARLLEDRIPDHVPEA